MIFRNRHLPDNAENLFCRDVSGRGRNDMDRRQRKSREAIFSAFSRLLAKENYSNITVQQIIDEADVGRTTFYAHFETKDFLLKELCAELFAHIVGSAKDASHTHGIYTDGKPESVFCHLLQHMQENDYNILGLLSGESSDLFLRYFRESLAGLIEEQFMQQNRIQSAELPAGFLVNHITGSFVEMTLWWIQGGMKYSPEELDRCFRAVIEPALQKL